MQDLLIGYLLDALEADEAKDVEARLRMDAESQRQLEVLRQGLSPLAAAGEAKSVPLLLAVRTCRQIRALRGGGE